MSKWHKAKEFICAKFYGQSFANLLGSSALAHLSVDIRNLYVETVRTSDAQTKSQQESRETLESIARRIDSIEEIHCDAQDSKRLLQDLCLSLTAAPAEESRQVSIPSDPSRQSKPLPPSVSSTQPVLPQRRRGSAHGKSQSSNEAPLAIPTTWQLGNSLSCPPERRCSCHTQQNVQALSSLANIIGRLFVAYSGSSVLQKPCNLSTCSQQNARSIRMTYFFPRWFLNSVVSTTFSTSRLGTPSLNLKVRKIVPETNRLFALCMTEGVDGIQQLFADREASPDDIHHRGGWTPLHVSHLPFAFN